MQPNGLKKTQYVPPFFKKRYSVMNPKRSGVNSILAGGKVGSPSLNLVLEVSELFHDKKEYYYGSFVGGRYFV